MPAWAAGLSAAEQAAVGLAGAADDERARGAPDLQLHPAVMGPMAAPGVDPAELYQWDCCGYAMGGYMVIKQLMDEAWIAAAEAAIDAHYTPSGVYAEPSEYLRTKYSSESGKPYDAPEWEDLDDDAQLAAATLGWDATGWLEGSGTAATGLGWEALSGAQRAAATRLGLDERSWPHAETQTGPVLTRPKGDRTIGTTLFRLRSPLAGTHRPSLGGLLKLPPPHAEPFVRMVTAPQLLERVRWMLGGGFVLTGVRHAAATAGGVARLQHYF
eukprot:SAG22_NODE_856_length_6839_cov_3.284570_7_plen_271_part_00